MQWEGFSQLDRYASQDMGRGEVTIVLKKLLPFSSQGVFREAAVFIVISVQRHQRIKISALDGILSLLESLQNLVHRVFIDLNARRMRDVRPADAWYGWQRTEVAALDLGGSPY